MSTTARYKIEVIALVVTLAISVMGFAKGWFILPDQVERNSVAIKEMKQSNTSDHDLMIRLNVQQEMMARDISEIKQAVKR